MSDIQIDEAMTRKGLDRLRPDKAAGVDDLSPRLLLELKDEICYPLTKIMQQSYNSGVGLPTLDFDIPGRPPVPSSPLHSFLFPSHLSFPFPVGPTPKPARGSSDVSSSSGSGAKPQPTNDLVHISEPKGAVLVATVFVHFHNNKFKFLYKHKTG